MGRRIFLKLISCLPFAGMVKTKMAKKSKSVESDIEPLTLLDEPPYNGQIYQSPCNFRAIVLWSAIHRVNEYMLLRVPSRLDNDGTNMMVCNFKRKDGSCNPFYTKAQLKEKLKDWILLEYDQKEYRCFQKDFFVGE